MRKVLLLNASEEVLKIVSWQKAVKMLMSGKARPPYNHENCYEIETTTGKFTLPTAIVLLKYVLLPTSQFHPTRANIFRRDKWTCQYCGFKSKDPKKLTLDHVVPRSKKGDSSWTNLTTACHSCNTKKGNKDLDKCELSLKSRPKKPAFYAMRLVGLDEDGGEMWARWLEDIHLE